MLESPPYDNLEIKFEQKNVLRFVPSQRVNSASILVTRLFQNSELKLEKRQVSIFNSVCGAFVLLLPVSEPAYK